MLEVLRKQFKILYQEKKKSKSGEINFILELYGNIGDGNGYKIYECSMCQCFTYKLRNVNALVHHEYKSCRPDVVVAVNRTECEERMNLQWLKRREMEKKIQCFISSWTTVYECLIRVFQLLKQQRISFGAKFH